ncbi:MAG: MCP four helix bundle domain-containing protein, partial [Desulfuromonadales bacterium]
MQWFKNVNISTKLLVSFMFILILSAALGIFQIVRLSAISKTAEDMAKTQLPAMLSISKISDLFGSYRRGELLEILSDKKEDVEKYIKRNQETLEKLKSEQTNYLKLIDSEEEKKIFAEFSQALQLYLAENPKIVELALENKDAEASVLARGASSKYFNQALKVIDTVMAAQTRQTVAESTSMVNISSKSRVLVAIALVVCIIIGIIQSTVISRIISRPLRDLADKAGHIADGNLNIAVTVDSRD